MAEKPPPVKGSAKKNVKNKDATSPQGASASSDDKNLADMTQASLYVDTEEEFVEVRHPTGDFRACPFSPLDAPPPSETREGESSVPNLVGSTSPMPLLPSTPTAATPKPSSADRYDPNSPSLGGATDPSLAHASRELFSSQPPPVPQRTYRRLLGDGYRAFAVELAADVTAGQDVPTVVSRCVELVDAWCSKHMAESTRVYSHGGEPEQVVQEIKALLAAGRANEIQSVSTPVPAGEAGAGQIRCKLFPVHSIAQVLLRYLWQLPNPVIPYEMYHLFIAFIDDRDVDNAGQRRTRLRDLVDHMPAVHQSTLRFLLAHLSRLIRWQSESGVKESYDILIEGFAYVLIRPPWNRISELVDNIKIHNDIVQELLRQGCWGETIPEIDAPTGFRVPPPAPKSKTRNFAPQDSYKRLQDAPWYWGNLPSKDAMALMKKRPNGAFMVRNSSTKPGEYTLMFKCEDTVKLLRILEEDGSYGFASPVEFTSVTTLISWYQPNSLAPYNRTLQIKLLHPVTRTATPDRPVGSIADETEELLRFTHHLRKQRAVYSYLYEWYGWCKMDTYWKHQAHEMYKCMLAMFTYQIQHHQGSPGVRADEEIARLISLRENVERCFYKLSIEIQSQEGKYRLIHGEMSLTRTEVKHLVNCCREWKDWLVVHGVNRDFLDNLTNLNESVWLVNCEGPEAESLLQGRPDGTFLIRPKQGEASPPKQGEASRPEQGETSHPEQGEASPPKQGEASPPEQGEASCPKQGEASCPKQGETSLPKQGEASPPEQGKASRPKQGEASRPEQGETSPPKQGEASPPEQGEASPPEQGEASPPEQGEASPPEQGEASPPEQGEASPAEQWEASHILSLMYQGSLHHCQILQYGNGYRFSPQTLTFKTLQDLVVYHNYKSLSEHKPELDVCLLYPVCMQEPSGEAAQL